jgi:FkbM family methyltransferase
MTELLQHPNGMFIRPDTYDHSIIGEVKRSYGWMDVKDKIVLDVGANIGAFTHHALTNGAKEVWAFEPDADNFALLQKNVGDDPRAKLHNAALISGTDKTIDFFLTDGTNHGNYSMYSIRGRQKVTVKASNFRKVLDHVLPEVIKMDCEGAEYDLLRPFYLPDSVQQFAMELHYNTPASQTGSWFDISNDIIASFSDWETVKTPKRNEKLWHTLGGWRR